MKLTIKMTCEHCFKIVEQDTGKVGWVSPPIYEDDLMCICQRAQPQFTLQGDKGKITLYLRGERSDRDDALVDCYTPVTTYAVLSRLKKLFGDFTILNCNKFVLLGD